MSLNALGVSQLPLPANASAAGAVAGAIFSWGAAPYSGLLCPSKYDVILGTTGAFALGLSAVALNQTVGTVTNLNIVSAAQAAACIVEVWQIFPALPPVAGATTVGAKYVGIVSFTAGPPALGTLSMAAVQSTGAVENTFTGTCAYRVYIPRVGYF